MAKNGRENGFLDNKKSNKLEDWIGQMNHEKAEGWNPWKAELGN